MAPNEEKIDTSKPQAKAAKEKSALEYYNECDFDNQTKSFSDFMQSQMDRRSQLVLPDSVVPQDSFCFFNKGKEMWKGSY